MELFPLVGAGSDVLSFQLHPVFGAVSSRVPPGNAMSCFVGLGDISWDNFKTFFQTQNVEFLFLSQRPRLAAFGGSILPKTPVLKLNRLKAASCNRKRINAGGLRTIRKTPGRRLSPSVGKVSSLGWLAHELANEP